MPTRRRLLSTAACATAAPGAARAWRSGGQGPGGQGPGGQGPGGQVSGGAAAALNAEYARMLGEVLDHSPETSTSLGLDTGPRARDRFRLDDRSSAARTDARARTADGVRRLEAAAARGPLAPTDAVNYEAVIYGLRLQADYDRAFDYAGPGAPYVLSQLNGAYQSVPDFLDTQHPVATRADAEAYLARLSAFAGALDGDIERARHDGGLGVAAPDFALDKALVQLRALRDAPAERAGLVQSLVRRAAAARLPGDYATPAAAIYESQVRPALDRQVAFLEDARRHAPHDAGVRRLPRGEAYYAVSLQAGTSTRLTPDEVHRTGLELVADLGSRIDVLLRGQAMTQGTTGARLRALFDDPARRYPNTDAGKARLIADLNVKVAQVQAALPRYFGVLPKAHVEIRRVPAAIEAGAPGGYYQAASLDGTRPGAFYINLRDTAEVPRWTLPTLVFHESIPGHHLQISIQQEAALPTLRKLGGYNAYVEGWALYAEQLAEQMGMYENDPFGRIGYLHDALLRAVRLVLDTGVHARDWSRERAIAYYVDQLGDPVSVATTEVERYCVWPGQACGYMVGKLAWLRARDRARRALGARFDIRRFHDAGLTCGALPLSVFDSVVDRYAASAGQV